MPKTADMALPVPTKTFLSRSPDTAVLFAPSECTHPPPPVPPFLLSQNLYPKDIAGCDIMKLKVSRCRYATLGLKGLYNYHNLSSNQPISHKLLAGTINKTSDAYLFRSMSCIRTSQRNLVSVAGTRSGTSHAKELTDLFQLLKVYLVSSDGTCGGG